MPVKANVLLQGLCPIPWEYWVTELLLLLLLQLHLVLPLRQHHAFMSMVVTNIQNMSAYMP
jgi:hypothetical protein